MADFVGIQRARCAGTRAALILLTLVASLIGALPAERARAQDVSEPAILQMFEARWDTIEDRMADIFEVGYGKMWYPPPQKAEGGQSVGYDLFDRFDLGGPRSETLYGTETGLRASINTAHDASVKIYTDFVPNHNGFRNKNTPGFLAQGGYPGFVLQTSGDTLGDFHDPTVSYQTDPINGSLFGLIDIAHEKNHQFIRNPTTAGNPNNIPAGTIWNKPDPNNARFYTDQGLGGIALNDPNTGGAFTRYNFNLEDPLAGDPRQENATGLLMRNMQYMLQVIGVDGFRIDAARHMPTWVFNYFDNAVFRSNARMNHDGSIQPVYMFSEVADGTASNVQPYIRRDLPNKLGISASDTTVKGNRDALDFPLFWEMVDNLSGNGTQNNWHNIRSAHLDTNDDGLKNGSQGVTFVDGHDEHQGLRPHLYKVAYAYTLMMPGNSIVYMNAKEFGEGREFPYDIGGSSNPKSNDALGGYHGDDVAELVEIRNTHGRGNFHERWLDDAFNPNGFSNIYIYEREASALVGLNSRADSGFDLRNPVNTGFDPNTVLVELTGNAADPVVDPGGNIPEAIRVNASGQVTMRVPRNASHGKGYVIYGLATPQGTLSLTNVSQTLEGATPTQATNGTARLADIDVITSNSFNVQLNTTPVTLPAPMGEVNPVRDVHADGDHAMIRIDDGMELNNQPGIDNTTLTSAGYGFENFTDTYSPGYQWDGSANIGTGSGTFAQSIDATQLSEGRHYITVRAFRHRNDDNGDTGDGGPAVFTDFKRTIYVDRLPPESALVSYDPYASAPNDPNNRDFIVRSVDKTADSMHILLDLPAGLTAAQILAQVNSGNQAGYYDRDMFIRGTGVNFGNHVATVVTYEPTGNYNIQRFAGLFTQTNNRGFNFGDMNFGNTYVVADIRETAPDNGSVEDVLYSQNGKFSSAFDVNGDGLGDNRDLFLLKDVLVAAPTSAFVNASNEQNVLNAYTDLLLKRADLDGSLSSNISDMGNLYDSFGNVSWTMDLDVNNLVDIDDVKTMVTELFRTLPGDFNLDGLVDTADYVIARKSSGSSGMRYYNGDADYDGDVDSSDLGIWQQNYGFIRQPLSASGGGGAGLVPEPSGLLLSVMFYGLVAATRRSIPLSLRERAGVRARKKRLYVTNVIQQ
jgi:glycosidase